VSQTRDESRAPPGYRTSGALDKSKLEHPLTTADAGPMLETQPWRSKAALLCRWLARRLHTRRVV
jgi:hypothetical protein